jgi:hypothetical protein
MFGANSHAVEQGAPTSGSGGSGIALNITYGGSAGSSVTPSVAATAGGGGGGGAFSGTSGAGGSG